MRKFECNSCEADCELTMQMDELTPSYCLYDKEKANWHEVKEEACKVSMQDNGERIQDNKLPDWVKVGAIGYDNKLNEYFEITNIDNDNVVVKFIETSGYFSYQYFNEFCSEARKRPFNAYEMKSLVGKIIEFKNGDATLATGYSEEFDEGVEGYSYGIWTCWGWSMGAKELMNECTIDGKPCFKLEHLNDKGEWVE